MIQNCISDYLKVGSTLGSGSSIGKPGLVKLLSFLVGLKRALKVKRSRWENGGCDKYPSYFYDGFMI